MRVLTKAQFQKMNEWIQLNARPYDREKWNYLFNGGAKEAIVEEMLRYQNQDGGMGHGFESDIQSPLSAAIPTAEAIFQAYDYNLDCGAMWFRKILCYFENTVCDIPKYWEDCPKEAMDSPHAPWWSYEPCTAFSPNPCAVAASALIRYGTESQKKLGYEIAGKCLELLTGSSFCGDHDTLNLVTLIEQLIAVDSSLVTENVIAAAKRRIAENTCFDRAKWNEYVFQPLDFVDSPDSLWYDMVKEGIEDNIDFWLDNINEQGVWNPNFAWGSDSEIARQVSENWKGYIAVKRARILQNFNRIEL